MTNKERFIEIYKTKIHRDGSEKLLEFLLSRNSDFLKLLPVQDITVIMKVVYWSTASMFMIV